MSRFGNSYSKWQLGFSFDAETREKTGTFWNANRSWTCLLLKSFLDINERNWIQFLFDCIELVHIAASFVGMNYFYLWVTFQVFGCRFLILQCCRNAWSWTPELIWPRKGWLWIFLLKYASFRWVYYRMDWNLQELLRCVSFLTTENFSRQFCLKGVLVCSLSVVVLLGHRFSNIDCWALAIRCNVSSYVKASFIVASSQLVTLFWHGCNTCRNRKFYMRSDACKNAHTQFTCETSSSSVKIRKFSCLYGAGNSCRVHTRNHEMSESNV